MVKHNPVECSRRKILTASAVGLSSVVGGIGTAIARSDQGKGRGKSGENDPFNPYDREEVREYHEKNFQGEDISSRTAEQNLLELSDEHVVALLRFTHPTHYELVVEEIDGESGDGESQDHPYEDKDITHKYVARNVIKEKMYTLTHNVYFEYNGHDSVRNIQSSAKGTTHSALWTFRGKDVDDREMGDEFDSTAQGTFEQCTTRWGCLYEHNPWTEVWGNFTGSVKKDSGR